jgi:predicted acylesterase/phospholipase RssA
MKGGITSGVVYPKAIAELSKRFTFKNVGGTSAGAIAAAAAAAAEYRRARTRGREGFDLLDELGEKLASTPPGSKNTFLFNLFEPNKKTRKVFNVFVASLGEKSTIRRIFDVTLRAFREYFEFAILGAVAGAALAVLSFLWSDNLILRWLWVAIGLLIAFFGGLVTMAAALVLNAIASLPSNYFGFCSGMPDPGSGNKSGDGPLTEWLTNYLNQVAGLDTNGPPLTFGHLWNPHENPDQGTGRDVNLEMMTTNLTHGRPYRLPFRYDNDLKENDRFYFRQDEFERLFPKCVVDWMITHPRPIEESSPKEMEKREKDRAGRRAKGYHPLPAPENLPVVVATRMSLSFPILLSLIPLHAFDYEIENPQLERCWFTDGGACSNFPLHFFDTAIPRRPTLSINLTAKPEDTANDELNPEMDKTNIPGQTDRWNRFDISVLPNGLRPRVEKGDLGKLVGFFGTLISTMQNWTDAMQSGLPGYRDRIVRIPLKPSQGGLNLTMPPDLVRFLSCQGTKSAEQLLEHFDGPPTHPKMNWENHRWIRLRALMASLEKMVNDAVTTCDHPESGDKCYEDWLRELLADTTGKYKDLSYQPTKDQLAATLKTLETMRELKEVWETAGTAAAKSPRPRPVLRPRPQI